MIKFLKNRGYSLLELMLTLAIISALVVSAFLLYKKVDISNKINQEKSNLTLIIAATKSLYVGKSDYTGWSMKTLMESNLLTDKFIYSKDDFGDYRDAWGNPVNTGTVSPGSGNVNISGIELLYEIPNDSCIKFVSEIYSLFDEVSINDIEIKDLSNNSGNIDLDAINKACNNGNSYETQSVMVAFY